MLRAAQIERPAQIVGNKRILGSVFGHLPFVHREHQYVFEIETTGFEHSHNLQSIERFTRKRHTQVKYLKQEVFIGLQVDFEQVFFQESVQALHLGIAFE